MAYCTRFSSDDVPSATHPPDLGGKARTLACLAQAGFPVLPGLVLRPSAFWASLPLDDGDDGSRPALPPTRLNPAVMAEVQQGLVGLGAPGQRWAVRSSALGEDGAQQSYAGQWETVLGVGWADLERAIVQVWGSAFSDTLQAYRQAQAPPSTDPKDRPQPPAVLLQPMLNPVAAGVAFSADPVSGRRGVTVIQAVYGLAAALVGGEGVGDTYRVSREGHILDRQLALHTQRQCLSPEGTLTWEPVPPADQQRAVLTDSQILAIAQLVRQISHHQGRPQDVEWAWVEDPEASPWPRPAGEAESGATAKLYLLQARPITTLAQHPDPDGGYGLWDNSNIVESYSGITTPLTFSFARKAYTEVYQQFCRFMGVPEGWIVQNRPVFQTMIGFLGGRVYYNLLSWYRVLTLLPGYRLNARFLEQMLGVQQGLPEAVMRDLRRHPQTHPVTDALRLVGSAGRIVLNYLTLNRRISGYHQRLNRVLMDPDQVATLPDQRPDELVGRYRRLEGELLTHWDAPLINDFFAMVFYGVLKTLVTRWGGDTTGALQNALISLTGDVISAEPAQCLATMADCLAGAPDYIEVFCHGSRVDIQRALATLPPLAIAYQQYLAKFGDRCLEELKLESPTLIDDPLPLLRTLGYMAQCRSSTSGVQAPRPPEGRPGRAKDLGITGLRAIFFGWVLSQTRRLVRNRENLRFERTRVFGQARRVFVELGKRFYALDWLADPSDIFFLEVEEIMGLVEGTATTLDLRGLVTVRQAEYQKHLADPPLPRRWETWGVPGLVRPPVASDDSLVSLPSPQGADTWQGMGCAPGRVQGRVCLVPNPRQWLQRQGAPDDPQMPRILVATTTDPGWVLLFPHAQGLLVERGSVLSHVAIVARELGLPMVSDLPSITTILQEGDWVVMDGRTGQVHRQPSGPTTNCPSA